MDEELKTYLTDMEQRLVEKQADMENRLVEGQTDMENRLVERQTDMENRLVERQTDMENRLVEKMRDMQTELLRGFESFSVAQDIRLRKVEADQSNLDTSLRGRVDVLESRLMQIELRLGIRPM